MPSGVRARARAERERLAAEAAAERVVREASIARRRQRLARIGVSASRLGPRRRRRGRQTGILAARRRTQTRLLIALLVVANVVVWLIEPSWAGRALALIASVLVAPVLYTVLFRKA
ncbi:hypothetical protein P5P86_08625 [Nocardioides sp. BP30]|uniref:hypothetical protein n=1 Tax=Nocardioides sp. BP30 TaxID=3036374 RepID=UPI002468F0DA|nr:hypothetical protein [Nocardioides sp. BP30]WGL53880.1 hypothetical protein P5P86_08625 [Nocardioides sp. BP30]